MCLKKNIFLHLSRMRLGLMVGGLKCGVLYIDSSSWRFCLLNYYTELPDHFEVQS